MPEEAYERTEPATPKKREEARKKGQVPQSRELPAAFILAVGLLILYFAGGWVIGLMGGLMREVFGSLASLSIDYGTFTLASRYAAFMITPFALGVVVAAVSANVLQKGFVLSAEPIKPQFSRVNPVEGFRRLFSLSSLMEFVKSGLKVLAVGFIGYKVLKGELFRCPEMLSSAPRGMLQYISHASFGLLLKVTIAFMGIAALDFLYQRWDYEKKLRMSRQELKDELKQREGDPQIKARLRSLQRQIARQRMMQRVKEADVVVTNPTRLAVALKYERGRMAAPMVVAKGRGFIAEKIREIATAAGVPIVENKPLAEILFRTVEIGQLIPEALYRAVAEILAYVYRIKGRRL